MRRGVFGGTFDPIHMAHLISAERLREVLDLDQVVFVPSAVPPHKAPPAASAEHRLAMVVLAVEGNEKFAVSGLEVARGGPSYSVDTLRELHRLWPDDGFWFIIGQDAFADIGSWKEASKLPGLSNFVVIPRGPSAPAVAADALGGSGEGRPSLGRDGRTEMLAWSTGRGTDVLWINMAPLPISSSEIRRRVGEGLSVRYLVPPAVEDYIRSRGLYNP